MDGPDVVAMAVSLLDPYAALALGLDEEGRTSLDHNEYEPLEMNQYRYAP